MTAARARQRIGSLVDLNVYVVGPGNPIGFATRPGDVLRGRIDACQDHVRLSINAIPGAGYGLDDDDTVYQDEEPAGGGLFGRNGVELAHQVGRRGEGGG